MHESPPGTHPSVGDLIRRYRERAGLSQEALAERAGLSPRGLLYLERGRRRPYPDTLRRLADALSLSPQEREALALAGRHSDAALATAQTVADAPADGQAMGATAAPPTGPLHNLPVALSSFIGREHARARVQELLAAHRLVTLIGAGGVGKTRLALAVAEELLGLYPDGVWLVELAARSDPALVPGTVALAPDFMTVLAGPRLRSISGRCNGRADR